MNMKVKPDPPESRSLYQSPCWLPPSTHLQHEAGLRSTSTADRATPDRRVLRIDAPGLDEPARTEMTHATTSKYSLASSNVAPAEITPSRTTGISVPAGSLSVDRACVNASSASRVTPDAS